MKKMFVILVVLSATLFVIPEFVIAFGVTTKMLATAAAMVAFLMLLYRFQVSCDKEIRKMREEQEKELKEKNTVIIGITPTQLWSLVKYTFPRMCGIIILCLGVYLAVSFSWNYIVPVLKYVGYVVGVLLAIIVVICAFAPSREKMEQMENTGNFC